MCWNTLKERVGAILFQSNHGNQCINPSRRPIIMLPTVAALAFCAYLQETRRPILSHVVVVYYPNKNKNKKTCVCVCKGSLLVCVYRLYRRRVNKTRTETFKDGRTVSFLSFCFLDDSSTAATSAARVDKDG